MKEMCKSIPYYVEWEKAVKTEYSIKIFKAAKRKIIKRFSKYNVANIRDSLNNEDSLLCRCLSHYAYYYSQNRRH